MKKLLVLLVSAALVLSLAAVSMAAATVSGSILAKYQFGDAAAVDSPDDQFEAAITAAGPVSDNVVGSITFKSDGSVSDEHFFVDAYSFKATFDWGTWTVGKWGYAVKGPVTDICHLIYDDFKATAAMAFEKTFDSGLNVGLWVSADADDVNEPIGDGAFVGTIGYTNEQFFASAYVINTGDLAVDKDGFAINLGYTGIENLIVYFNYEDADLAEDSMVLGAKYTYNNFWAMAEMQLNDDFDEDNYGVRFNYTFANKIFAQYRWVNDGDINDVNELRIGVSF